VFRTGFGYDLHRLEKGRKLVLGGVEIPGREGLAGHSDGDCLTHAVIDALLGAAGEADIGRHFPDTDPRWNGARSVELLALVMEKLKLAGWRVENVDSVVVAERPLLAPHIPAMKQALAPVLGISADALGIKAKTNEGLGLIGKGKAVACWASVLISRGRA
jgi:2-C-methyl-D-erythritol 2,4-cyclodiphosphate synthase